MNCQVITFLMKYTKINKILILIIKIKNWIIKKENEKEKYINSSIVDMNN